jgi:hypothetical protein
MVIKKDLGSEIGREIIKGVPKQKHPLPAAAQQEQHTLQDIS